MSRPAGFATTRWSLVIAATRREDPAAEVALAELCERYWYPLYAFLRRQGIGENEAMDGVQGFLARLLEHRDLAANEDRGRFRSYLIGALRHHLATQRRYERAERRGGGRITSLASEFGTAEDRYSREPVDDQTPETLFERRWAMEVLERSLARLREEAEARGRGALFRALESSLATGTAATQTGESAALASMTPGAIKVARHRLRRRMGELIREEVADTLRDPDHLDDEVAVLLAALG